MTDLDNSLSTACTRCGEPADEFACVPNDICRNPNAPCGFCGGSATEFYVEDYAVLCGECDNYVADAEESDFEEPSRFFSAPTGAIRVEDGVLTIYDEPSGKRWGSLDMQTCAALVSESTEEPILGNGVGEHEQYMINVDQHTSRIIIWEPFDAITVALNASNAKLIVEAAGFHGDRYPQFGICG